MKRWFRREVLRFVDAWACREGTPEDDEDAKAQLEQDCDEGGCGERGRSRDGGRGVLSSGSGEPRPSPPQPVSKAMTVDNGEYAMHENSTQEWVELDVRMHVDEELGRDVGPRS